MHARQVVVQQHHIRKQGRHVAQRLAGVARFGHDLEFVALAEQGRQTTAKQSVVIDHQQANGHGK